MHLVEPDEPVLLRVTGSDGEIVIEQGKKFTIAFECVDSEGQVVSLGTIILLLVHNTISSMKDTYLNVSAESGRSFAVSAAVRKTVASRINRSKSRLQQMTSQTFPEIPSIQVPL